MCCFSRQTDCKTNNKKVGLLNRFVTHLMLLWTFCVAGVAHASYPIYADGDLAPLGTPDGLINTADYLVATRIVLGQLTPTDLE